MKRLADPRTLVKTLDDADALMNAIASASCELALEEAKAEKRIARIKLLHAVKTEGVAARIKHMEDALGAFILANKDKFLKPRKRKCAMGSYGLQKAKELVVSDEDKLIQHLMDSGYDDCLKVKRTPIKKPIIARIEDDESMPGASLKEGDTAVSKVDSSLIKQAVEEGCES